LSTWLPIKAQLWNTVTHTQSWTTSASLFKSICRVTQSWWFSIVRYKIQSSANKRVLDETDAGKSLMNTRKSSGTRTDPLSHELLNNLHTGKQTDLIILDFSKAFDKVPHKKLLRKLDNYGIRGPLLVKWCVHLSVFNNWLFLNIISVTKYYYFMKEL
jgi:hypothetical protein